MNNYLTQLVDSTPTYKNVNFLSGDNPIYNLPVTAKSPAKKAFDLTLVEEMDDNEYLSDVLGLFLAKTQGELNELQEACTSMQFDTVYKMAHKLKSGVGLFGAGNLMDLLIRIESAAKDKNAYCFSDLCKALSKEFKEIEIPLLKHLMSIKGLLNLDNERSLIETQSRNESSGKLSIFKVMRILIVDDHSIVRKGLKQLLFEAFPFAVIDECVDAEEVIKKTIEYTYDIVISDLSMPGRSGLDILQQLKQNFPKMPVLILSMHPEDLYAIRALKAGAAGYLNKEIASEELVNAVNKVLQGKKYISPFIAEKMANDLNRDTSKALHELLSQREFEVFKMLSNGKSVSDISEKLSLSITKISTYRSRVLDKMNMKANADLTRYALENKLI
jgi:two-component system, NarL family, invasion response regulator UvrY